MSDEFRPQANGDAPILTERQRAMRALGLGAVLGLVLRILGRRS